MPILRKLKLVTLAGALAFSGVSFVHVAVQAQTADVATSLSAAITAGDTAAINALIAANSGNPAVIAQIAATLLASAQATTAAGNATGGAMLAALAVSSGGLTGANVTLAQNMVSSNPAAIALLTNPNAPSVGGGLAGTGVLVAAQPAPQTPANNPNQTTGSPS